MKKKFSNEYFKLILVFVIGLLITFPLLQPSFNVDFYCTMKNGFLHSSKTFLKAGRLFTASVYFINYLLKMPYNLFSTVSLLLANVFLSFSCFKVFMCLKEHTKNNKIKLFFTLVGCFLMFYNPLTLELLLFEEAFVICAGIFFSVLAAINFVEKKNHLLTIISMLIAVTCYQGVICFFLPLVFLLEVLYLNGDIRKEYKIILKKGIIAGMYYGFSLVFTFIVVKIVNTFILTDGTQKLGHIDIIYNVKKFFTLLFNSSISLFGYCNRLVFYFTILVFLVLIILILNKKNKNNFIKYLYMLLNISLCFIMPFIPNLGMNSASNYTAARMACSIGATIGLLIIYFVLYFDFDSKKNKIVKNIFYLLVTFFFMYNSYKYIYTSFCSLNRYKEDMISINRINIMVDEYEKKNNVKIKTIYYTKDSSVNYFYYKYKLYNSHNFRLYAIDWAMKCSVNINNNYEYIEMTKEEKEKYFKDKEYDVFSKEQFVFENEKLYMLIY